MIEPKIAPQRLEDSDASVGNTGVTGMPFPQWPLGRDPKSVRQRIEAMERLLERGFVVPGTKLPIGLDSVIGLVPVVGDVATAILGAYIVWEARNLGMPKWKVFRMAGNVVFDTAVGSVPLAGDVFDYLFRSNTKNFRIIKMHLDRHHPATQLIEQ